MKEKVITEQYSSKFNENTDIRIFFCYSYELLPYLHDHEFYEFFYVISGYADHLVNGKTVPLKEGDLVFMRKKDIHKYGVGDCTNFHYVNIAFPQEVLDDVSAFFKHGNYIEQYCQSEMPPVFRLTVHEKDRFLSRLKQYNLNPRGNNPALRVATRMLLADIFYRYCVLKSEQRELLGDCADWFQEFYTALSGKELFTKGMGEILGYSKRSREYLCRYFKKVTGMTLSQQVKKLRVNYACNLLENTDMEIIEIAAECGYENLSTFYHAFRELTQMTPNSFRKN